jgi:hypothetical protein
MKKGTLPGLLKTRKKQANIISSNMTFLLSILLTCTAFAETFTFSPQEKKWYFWGSGVGGYSSEIGHNDKSSIWLSSDVGETHTTHFYWGNLTPGFYEVTAYVRARDVLKGADGSSFWHFYDGGEGTISPYYDLHGSYEWRKVKYTLKVIGSKLTMWFRLRSPGEVWIDDVSLNPVKTFSTSVEIHPPKRLDHLKKKDIGVHQRKTSKIFSFERAESGHPFSVVSNNQKQKMGKLQAHKFYNFNVQKINAGNWSAYDRIEMEVFNPGQDYREFFLTLTDDRTYDYWTQLNHKSHLAPGWNKLSFSLKQFVGERGSHRYRRPIDLKNIEKFFVIVDPDKKQGTTNQSFFIDNISLESYPFPLPPAEVKVFDFTSHHGADIPGVQQVLSRHSYDDERKYGFSEAKFWRVEDSQYANELWRHTIGLLSGHFKVKVPDGKYRYHLVLDKLGYWDPPFWSDRTVLINGNPVFKESRSHAEDYLLDYLQFEATEPKPGDHPFELYLQKLLRPVEGRVVVKNGILDFEFNGDASAISLNSLILWQEKDDKKAEAFFHALNERNKLEYDWLSRPLRRNLVKKKNVSNISIVVPDLWLTPSSQKQEFATGIELIGAKGERPYSLLQVESPQATTLNWKISPLKNEAGDVLDPSEFEISRLVNQYTSPDLNHETYLLAGKYLAPLKKKTLKVSGGMTHFVWLEIFIKDSWRPGVYQGQIDFDLNGKKTTFPISLRVFPYQMPEVDFPVGFFGLDPIPHNYFPGKGMQEVRRKYRYLALEELSRAGFTTFTSLPDVPLRLEKEAWEMNTEEIDHLFLKARELGFSQPVFTYGGQFPQNYLDESKKPSSVESDLYRTRISLLLQQKFKQKNWLPIVHTFSDEAAGYSDKIDEDIKRGQSFKEFFPFLSLGGFSSQEDGSLKKLNDLFDYGFYSSFQNMGASKGSKFNKKWGSYNAAAGNLDDPRSVMGPGLYLARKQGLSHYLEWHLVGFNNYPYYELDGRESDVSMLLPGKNGVIYQTLRYKFAVEGLHFYRKITLLEKLLETKNSQGARSWLDKLQKDHNFWSTSNFLKANKLHFQKLTEELNHHLMELSNN